MESRKLDVLSPEPTFEPSRRWIFWSALCAILGLTVWLGLRNIPKTTGGRTTQVKRTDLVQKITVAGTIEPIRSTTVTAPFDGYLQKIFVRQGQKVKVGDPLVTYAQTLTQVEGGYPIRVPFNGTVVQINRSEGQFVKLNDAKDFSVRVDDLSRLFVFAPLPELEMTKVKIDQQVIVRSSSLTDKTYEGVVREVAMAPIAKDGWSGRAQVEYMAKIEIINADDKLVSGMSAIVDVIAQKRDAVVAIGHEFLERDKDDYQVTLKSGEKRKVKIGLQTDLASEVIAGLNEGDEVKQIDFLDASTK